MNRVLGSRACLWLKNWLSFLDRQYHIHSQTKIMATTNTQALRRLDSYPPERLPESDGKPMAETDTHRKQMFILLDALEEYLRPYPRRYASGKTFVYYRDDADERQSVAPDIFVVLDVENKERRYYNIEEEGKAPDLIIELISTGTKLEDLGNKRVLYANLGVREYYVFDPTGEVLKGQLRGFRLNDGEYIPIIGSRLQSQVLDIDLVVEQGRLRLYDRKTGLRLLTYEESEAARRKAEAKATAAAEKAATAETKAAQELAARQMAEAKAAAAEAEMTRLREDLAKLRAQPS
jgi:Uma2 family endonuclease